MIWLDDYVNPNLTTIQPEHKSLEIEKFLRSVYLIEQLDQQGQVPEAWI